jgi:hypothetical protein
MSGGPRVESEIFVKKNKLTAGALKSWNKYGRCGETLKEPCGKFLVLEKV